MTFMATVPIPKRGDVGLIDFDPSVGAAIRKVRPAMVINLDTVGRLPLRLVVPITDWKPQYSNYSWFVKLTASPMNGLTEDSGADAIQTSPFPAPALLISWER
jgi:mRNA interferase MazF